MRFNNFAFFASAALTFAAAVYPRSAQTSSDDTAAGISLLRRSLCAECHVGAAKELPFAAPSLARAGARMTPDYLYKKLDGAAGTGVFHSPDLLNPKNPDVRKQQINDLQQFLVTLGGAMDGRPAGVEREEIDLGRKLYLSIGCVACHEQDGAKLDQTTKTTLAELSAYLLDPSTVHGSGRMPSLNLTKNEARSIAVYLLERQIVSLTKTAGGADALAPGLKYQIYKGSWSDLPDFNKMTPVADGVVEKVALPPNAGDDHFGARLSGKFTCDAGKYTFYLTSDDGSKLTIDGKDIITNDGVHPSVTKSAEVSLTSGVHDIRIDFFEFEGGELLQLEYKYSGSVREEVPAHRFSHAAIAMAPAADSLQFTADPPATARGKHLYQTLGCASCHPVDGVKNQHLAPSFASMRADADDACYVNHTTPDRPRYAFDEIQQKQIRAAVLELQHSAPAPRAANDDVADLIQFFQCTKCHSRDGLGGPDDATIPFFTTLGEAEMGDEGRIPPTLTGVGRKLKKDWLAEVLLKHGTARPYMATRMPRFDSPAIRKLAQLLPIADGAGDDHEPEFDATLTFAARDMCDAGAFSCITCHKLAGNNSLGIPAVDLANTTKRLRYDWFRDYMLEPSKFRPGTRMPQFWPDGKSSLTRILDGNTQKQIEALWIYCKLGDSMPPPKGLKPGDLELRPTDGPIVFRTFFKDVGPRAICIGFPEGMNCVFDAGSGRLAKIWKGKFINASPAWVGRAGQYAEPLGTNIINMPDGPVYSPSNNSEDPWPDNQNLKYQFNGYSNFGSVPLVEISYHANNKFFIEAYQAKINHSGSVLIRRIIFPDHDGNGFLRLATAKKITKVSEYTYQVEDSIPYKISFSPDFLQFHHNFSESPAVRIQKKGEMYELLVGTARLFEDGFLVKRPYRPGTAYCEVIYEW